MPQSSETGNIFIIILVAIGLFAALAFTVSRGSNTKSTNLLTRKQAQLAASDIMNYAQNVARGVRRVQDKYNCSETEISFEPPPFDGSTAYDNANAPGDFSCHVFHPSGGSVSYREFSEEWRNSSSGSFVPVITGSSCIPRNWYRG